MYISCPGKCSIFFIIISVKNNWKRKNRLCVFVCVYKDMENLEVFHRNFSGNTFGIFLAIINCFLKTCRKIFKGPFCSLIWIIFSLMRCIIKGSTTYPIITDNFKNFTTCKKFFEHMVDSPNHLLSRF